MKYNFKEYKCECGQDLKKELTKFLYSLEVIYDTFDYVPSDWEAIVCPKCKKEYFLQTGNMTVDIFIHEDEGN